MDKWLMFQNYVQNKMQADFDNIIRCESDPRESITNHLDCGDLAYDMLTDNQKYYINFYNL